MNGLKGKKIYLDANIFIYLFEENTEFAEVVKYVFQTILDQRKKIVSSTISLTEILSFPSYSKQKFTLLKNIYLQTPNLISIDVNYEVAIQAAIYRKKYNLRLPDSIHLATASIEKVDTFVTNDNKLLKCKDVNVLTLNSLMAK